MRMTCDRWLRDPYENVWFECPKCKGISDESSDGEHCLECCEEMDEGEDLA